jgi:2-dehydropantoate 2-reductase
LAAGSICTIAATLNNQREAVQLAKLQSLNFGERDGKMSDRATLAASYGPRSRPRPRSLGDP